MENKEIKIHESNMILFNQRVAELNQKFQKKELPEIKTRIIKEPSIENGDEIYEVELSSDFDQTNLKGIEVNFEGVVSLIDLNENDKIFTFKNENISKLLPECSCDECKKKIKRGKYIVFSKAGKEIESREDLIVLGTKCATNYFPFSVENYIGNLESIFEAIIGDFDEEYGHLSFRANSENLGLLYDATLAMTNGLQIYKKEGETREEVKEWIEDPVDKYGHHFRDRYPIPENTPDFSEMKEWLNEAFNVENPANDFLMNARATFFKTNNEGVRELRNAIPNKFVGIAIYGFISAKKNHDKIIQNEAKKRLIEKTLNNEYFGQVGDKFKGHPLKVRLEKINCFENDFGYTYLWNMKDEAGHSIVWFSSNGPISMIRGIRESLISKMRNLPSGFEDYRNSFHEKKCTSKDENFIKLWNENYRLLKIEESIDAGVPVELEIIGGSIKDHKDYTDKNGITYKQTVVTRCKIDSWKMIA